MSDDDRTIPRYTPAPGDQIREYEIIEEIGRGGMATVYKARHTLINQVVAIKIMKSPLTSDPQFYERFLREAQTQAQLTGHQNIVTIHNFIEEHGLYLIVMEYVDGIGIKGKQIRTVAQQIKNFGAMDIWHFRPILDGVISGLSFAHEQNIIHRDIKPSNIMFSNKGVAKIADFGIAQIISEQRLTRTGFAVGTAKYMSPEQVRGKELNACSDIYSLGITIYETLTGKVPFEGDTDYEIMRKQEEEEPISPKKLNSRIPDVWEYLILKCIAKNPDERPQNYKGITKILDKKFMPVKKPVRQKIADRTFAKPAKKVREYKAAPITRPKEKIRRIRTTPIVMLGVVIVCVILAALYYYRNYYPARRLKIIPDLKWTGKVEDEISLRKFVKERLTSIGNVIAHSTYVEDMVIMKDEAKLNEVIIQLCQDEPEITFIHFTDDKNRVIASNNSTIVGNNFNSDLLITEVSNVEERHGVYESGFRVMVGGKKVGALYFGVAVGKADKHKTENELLTNKFTSLGHTIAHSTYVEDVLILKDESKLNEIITRLLQDEPEITYIHFTTGGNKVIASNDNKFLGEVYESNLLVNRTSVAREKNSIYECAFSITVSGTRVGALYFGAMRGY
jgi:serine/threonine protein kinase